ncbi:FG-GAP repeat protein [Caulifigura coniformis]|uniref:FG-GAP repeat protein n=1 Tax=Caulifigura coniformis TaxID=2527983 RepID=A0A517SBD1_9PLAN|nr:VCBS repeat-containing protein [Caulifigura coniformis]QDT53396.1 FG-GAP repeat protein [Caulifigura coniformis]
MIRFALRRPGLCALVLSLLSAPLCGAAETTEVPLDHYYGFQPLEIVKLSDRAHSLQAGDFNNDGLIDVVAVDNSKNRITLLLQRSKKIDPTTHSSDQVNQIEDSLRFETRHLPVDRDIQALCMGDFNGDGRIDLAHFGEPDRLTIRYQPESGVWKDSKELRLPEIQPKAFAINSGDLNGDKRTDLVALGKSATYVILQKEDGTLADPVVLRNTSPSLGLAMIADLNGDGRDDLFTQATDDQKQPFCIRLQNGEGKLGPELRFRLEEPRGIVLQDMDGKPGAEILAIDSRTNRVRMFSIEQKGSTAKGAGGDEKLGRIVQYGYGGAESGDRDLEIADVDGDGRPDVVVSDPDKAQVVVFLQKEKELDLGTSYPSFLGASQLRLSDIDGDKAAEVVVFSSKENSIGISKFEDGRLGFPKNVETTGELKAFEMVDLNGDGKDELVVVTKDSAGRGRGASKYNVSVFMRGADGKWGNPPSPKPVEVELKGDPHRMVKVDANLDGKWDLLLTYDGGKAPKLLLQKDGELLPEAESGGIQLGEVRAGAVFNGQLDKPAFLVAQGNFARSMTLDAQNKWQVLDQYNAGESNSRVEGVATLDMDGQPGNEIVLIDTGANKIRIFRKSMAGYSAWRELELAPFQYRGLKVADLNGDGRADLVLAGPGRFAVVYAGQSEYKLTELASFESKLKDVFLMDLVAGDLNHDGIPDVAVFDARTHLIEILAYQREKAQLVHAIQFKVFESKSFQRSSDSGFQPREGAIADVTGDKLADLLLLSHDRLLVYPQDGGEAPAATKASAGK